MFGEGKDILEENVQSNSESAIVSVDSNHVEEIERRSDVSIASGAWDISGIAVPMMISFSMSFIMIATAMFSGRLNDDPDHVAATSLTTAIANSISAIAFGPLFALGLIMSRLYGEAASADSLAQQNSVNHEGINRPNLLLPDQKLETTPLLRKDKKAEIHNKMAHYSKNGIALAGIATCAPTLILALSGSILNTIGQNTNVSAITQQYLRVFSAAMPGWAFRVVNEQIMFSCLKQKPTAMIGIANFSLTTLLSYMLGFGLLFPKMELPGVALGYVAESYLTPVMLTAYIMLKKDLRKIGFFRKWNFNRERDCEQLREILTIAAPMFLSFINEFGAQLVINNLMGLIGTRQLAAQNFMSQYYFLAYFPLISYAQGTSQTFSRAFGAREYANARTYAISGALTIGIITSLLSLGVSLYPKGMTYLLVNQSENNADWFPILQTLAPIGGAGIVFDSIGFNFLQVLRAGGDNVVSSTISAATLWAGVLAGGLLAFNTSLGAYGLAAGYSGGLLLRALILGSRWAKMINTENLRILKEEDTQSVATNRSFPFWCTKKSSAQPSHNEQATVERKFSFKREVEEQSSQPKI